MNNCRQATVIITETGFIPYYPDLTRLSLLLRVPPPTTPVALSFSTQRDMKTKKRRISLPASLRASCRIRTNDPEITNHVLWPTELKRQNQYVFISSSLLSDSNQRPRDYKSRELTISRRYNQLPLLRSSPGGFEGSWPYGTYPYFIPDRRSLTSSVCGCKGRYIFRMCNISGQKNPHFYGNKCFFSFLYSAKRRKSVLL